jgi:hypothetical protein
MHARTNDPLIERTIRSIESASALGIASPIFKALFSGLLKAFLDFLPQYALAGKVILLWQLVEALLIYLLWITHFGLCCSPWAHDT